MLSPTLFYYQFIINDNVHQIIKTESKCNNQMRSCQIFILWCLSLSFQFVNPADLPIVVVKPKILEVSLRQLFILKLTDLVIIVLVSDLLIEPKACFAKTSQSYHFHQLASSPFLIPLQLSVNLNYLLTYQCLTIMVGRLRMMINLLQLKVNMKKFDLEKFIQVIRS